MVSSVDDLPLVLLPGQVADLLSVNVDHVYSLIRDGKLRAINIGRSKRKPIYRIRREDALSFINGDVEQGRSAERAA